MSTDWHCNPFRCAYDPFTFLYQPKLTRGSVIKWKPVFWYFTTIHIKVAHYQINPRCTECILRKRDVFPWASYQIRKIAGCACAGNAGKVLSRHRLQRKPIVSDPGMHHGTCDAHVPWCMLESLNRGGGENAPGIPGACAAHSFTYLSRGPSAVITQYWDGRGSWNHSLMKTMTNSCCISNVTTVDGVTIQFQWNYDGRFIYDGKTRYWKGPISLKVFPP